MQQKIAGRYVLQQALGAHLHLAYDERTRLQVLAREVEPPPELNDDERRALAEEAIREAGAASRVGHPAVNAVLDAVSHDGRAWIVTQSVNGRPLTQVVAGAGPLSPEQTAVLGLDVWGALSRAHTMGVVHGDVQPENVWVTPEGRGVLTGFGTGVAVRSQAASSIGTPGFTAPEKTTRPVPASDLWSLGATLYFAVEGVPPFTGDGPMAVLSAVLSADPRPPERAGELGPVLLELLAKDPARRPAAAGEALAELARPAARKGRQVPVRPAVLAVLTACFAVAVASVTTIATVLLGSPQPSASPAEASVDTEPGRFAAVPRACGLISDEQAGELFPDFAKDDGSGVGSRKPNSYCKVSSAGSGSSDRSLVIELFVLRPGPHGGGPATARRFLTGAKEEAPLAAGDGGTVSPVRELRGAGEQAIAYDVHEADGEYATNTVVVVNNAVAVVSCEQEVPADFQAGGVVRELGECAEKAAGWVGAALTRTG